jgi:DNA polymerase-2
LTAQTLDGFLLTRNWRDAPEGIELEFWFSTAQGPLCALVRGEHSVFFLAESALPRAQVLLGDTAGLEIRPVKLRDFALSPVVGLYFRHYRKARKAADTLRAHGLDPLEADINPADRYLMERFVAGSARLHGTVRRRGKCMLLEDPAVKAGVYRPALKVVSFDIETAMEGLQLYSIAAHGVSAAGRSGRCSCWGRARSSRLSSPAPRRKMYCRLSRTGSWNTIRMC